MDEGEGFAQVEFLDLGGVVYRATLTGSGGPPQGKQIDLVYDPADPSVVSQGSAIVLWLWPCLVCVLGVSSVLVGADILAGVL